MFAYFQTTGFAEGAGMITAGNPNKGVDNDDWSEATGGDSREAEVEAWLSDPKGFEEE